MNINQLIHERYSVRDFSDRVIEQEKLNQILEAGRLAPTAKNLQPQRVYVLTGETVIKTIRQITPSAYNAPIVLMIGTKTSEAWVNPYSHHSSAEMDASIVTTQMMLAAWELGIGSVWVCWFDVEKVKKAFSIPQDIDIFCLLPIGYPAIDCVTSRNHLNRKSLSEMVSIIDNQ
ncbi:MAG: nitroreductase family protein [Candidatus Izemoplasmatales bacterium]|jgi:nitroreductase|nr:nitroreductase family protein [Candidatus Izemoplasmatales bacterium]MDD3865046.1 nitroreductase family protein [Candidatus Izemoplasmatales bacterium]